MTKIHLDAGHGAKDPGAVKIDLQEKDIVLRITKYVETYLKENFSGVQIQQTRSTDVFLSLDARADKANLWKADLFVSFHVNAGGGTGYESFVYNKGASTGSKNLQKAINKHAMTTAKKYGLGAHGGDEFKEANLAVLRETSMPAVLTEICYIDSKDNDLLHKEDFIKAMAHAYAEGIAEYAKLSRKKEVPVSSDSNEKFVKGTYFRVIAGSYSDRDNAEDQMARLIVKGQKVPSFLDAQKVGGKTVYRVIAGSYTDKKNAEDQVAFLKAAGIEAFIAAYTK
jgi:N-acetylmuramoyl-L-alanine amidase